MILEELLKSPSFNALKKALSSGESILFESLWDTPRALLAASVHLVTKKPVLFVTGGVREDALISDLETLLPNVAIEFPSWETLPGEEILPSPDIIGKRFDAFKKLIDSKIPPIVLCPLQSLLQKVPPKESFSFIIWKKGSKVEFATLADLLKRLDFKQVSIVSDKGEFSLRGGICDIFPVGSTDPFRIEFWGDEIEEIRTFDPVGQKSIGRASEVLITPAQESKLLYGAKKLCSILDWLGEDTLIFWDDFAAIEEGYASLKNMPGAKTAFFQSLEDLFKKRLKHQQQLFGAPEDIEKLSANTILRERSKYLQTLSFEAFHETFHAQRWFHPFRPLEELSGKIENALFLNANETEEADVKRQLAAMQISFAPTVSFQKGILTSGFAITDVPLLVIPNSEITHRKTVRRQKWRGTTHTPAAEFHQLSINDPVVHFHSGIGKYLGTEKHINHLGQETEFLAIEYADNGKLYVPMSQAYLVSRYIGSREDVPALSTLGSKRWQNTRMHAQQQILGYANELLQLYAERASAATLPYPPDSALMNQFERDFPYAETSDQLLAIQAIREDLMSDKPMDRLVCGDVGYGKTEVAMRAAFKAVVDGHRQVAVLVPTTVLAMQHYETFTERMRGFPVSIGVVSRFHTQRQNKETLENCAKGTIQILVGTHRILSKDVQFKNLGLLIIDEEQRFGVKAKEHLKRMKATVSCLTLSATPIPRTLYMSLVSLRSMSAIATPPQDRLPIKTIIAENDSEVIQNALLRELARGGQAFFIHNRVESIFERAAVIQKLIPAARIGIVHGQMDSDEIDSVFHRFKSGLIDLLFATTIVENGIDIPNANTILIDRADTYGVADLYQLRGRVGRWNRSAYAYFLVPKDRRLPEASMKRLNALVEASGYGGGMKIAMRDLEIRGAGDILGIEQSGQVSAIGFHLYCKLLKRAIEALKKKAPLTFNEVKLESPFNAKFPETYIAESSLRMELYYRLGEAMTVEEVDELYAEIKDRFGPAPEPVIWLYHLTRLRVFAAAHQFTLLKFQTLTLLVERQLGKKVEQQTLLLPKKLQTPAETEQYVVKQLKEKFNL